jgi:hypothetical protein
MNENSTLTDTYKAEIAGILNRVSAGLTEKVTTAIEPKIQSISSDVRSQYQLVENFKTENEKNSKEYKERIKSFESKTQNLGKSIEQQNSVIVSLIKKNTDELKLLRETFGDDLISEIKEISLNVKAQKDLKQDIIAENKKISEKLNQRLEYLELAANNTESTTEKMESLFQQGTSDIISLIEKNSNILFQLKQSYENDLVSEIRSVSNNEELKSINVEVMQLKAKLKTTKKLLLTTLVFLLVLSSLIVSLIYK